MLPENVHLLEYIELPENDHRFPHHSRLGEETNCVCSTLKAGCDDWILEVVKKDD